MSKTSADVSNFTAEEAIWELQMNYINRPFIQFKRKKYNDYMDTLIRIIEESEKAEYSLMVAQLYPKYIPQMFNCLYKAYSNSRSANLIVLLWLDKIKYAKNTELKKMVIARHDNETIADARSSPDLSDFCNDFYEDLTPEEQLGVII